MDKEKKCDKYEAFFVFQDEEGFMKHLETCEDCRKEHEKYLKVSSFVKEVAREYKAEDECRRKKQSLIKKAACCCLLFFGLSAVTGYRAFDAYTSAQYDPGSEYVYYGNYGLPVDDYGFLEI